MVRNSSAISPFSDLISFKFYSIFGLLNYYFIAVQFSLGNPGVILHLKMIQILSITFLTFSCGLSIFLIIYTSSFLSAFSALSALFLIGIALATSSLHSAANSSASYLALDAFYSSTANSSEVIIICFFFSSISNCNFLTYYYLTMSSGFNNSNSF